MNELTRCDKAVICQGLDWLASHFGNDIYQAILVKCQSEWNISDDEIDMAVETISEWESNL